MGKVDVAGLENEEDYNEVYGGAVAIYDVAASADC